MKPTVGRIVLVKSPAYFGELPAIVTAVFANDAINCRVFTNEDDHCPLMTLLQKQDAESLSWGWRWPERAPVSASMQRRQAYERLMFPEPNTAEDTPDRETVSGGDVDAGGLPGPGEVDGQ